MSCLVQSCHPFPEALLHLKLLGTDFINGRPRMRKLHEFKAKAPIKMTIDWNKLDLGVRSLELPPIDLFIASLYVKTYPGSSKLCTVLAWDDRL